MKKLAYSLAVIFFAALSSCSSKGAQSVPDVSNKGPEDGLTNIRFYFVDSVSVNYALVEELNAVRDEAATKYQIAVNNLQNFANQKQAELQSLAQAFQNKVQNNTFLTQQSAEAEAKSIQDKQAQAERLIGQRQQAIAEMENELAILAQQQQKEIFDSIENFLKAYSEVNKFDAIIAVSKGMGTYVDERLDITDEVVRGLNARYTGHKDAKAAKADAPEAAPEATK